MRRISFAQAATWMGAESVGHEQHFGGGVFTDSRKIIAGGLFVALKGERFDGHSYVGDVLEGGAAGAVVSAAWWSASDRVVPEGKTLFLVEDPVTAFQRLAGGYRAMFNIPVIAVTGSNGKTSTKEFAAAALGGVDVLWTEGNLNNHIGVPLTLMRMDDVHRAAVVEMGMNHAGELAPLVAMAAPSCSIITCVGVAHIEHLGSRDAIAAEKVVVAEGLPVGGVAVLNAEDDYFGWMRDRLERMGRRVIGVGADAEVDFRDFEETHAGSRCVLRGFGGEVGLNTQVPGRHMALNAALGVVAAVVSGVDLYEAARRVESVQAAKGRLRVVRVGEVEVLDDTYNANPDSMVAALKVLASRKADRRIAVLGRMGELGTHAQDGHARVGREAGAVGVEWLVAVGGEEAGWIASSAIEAGVARVDHFPNTTIAADALRRELRSGDTLLVKGSRSAHMEAVITEIAS